MNNMVRVQLDFPEEKVAELDTLMQEADITTRKDLFNNALTLLAWALNERKKGNIVVSLNEEHGTYKELVMPILSTAHKKAEAKAARAVVQERAAAVSGSDV